LRNTPIRVVSPAALNRLLDLLASVPLRVRQGALVVTSLAGLALFAKVAHHHYPLQHWLLFFYARLWLMGLGFMLAAFAAGWRVLSWLLPAPSAPGERIAVSMGLGLLIFVAGLFVCGIVGVLGTPVFFAWPLALLALCGPRLVRDVRRFQRRLRPFGFRLFQPRSLVEAAAAASLVVGLVAIYLQVLTPQNVSFDSNWYHLPIAEQYARAGAIRPFVEGWILGAVPQLASLVYMWAFLSPGGAFEHVMLACHLEWFLFLATLFSVSVLARRLLGGVRAPYAAAAMFLFPGIFLYDSSLIATADHIMAFWGPPLALALLRLRRWFSPREAVAAALITSGAALTKYQASYMVSGAILAVVIWTIRRRRLLPLAAYALTGIAATTIHWLKNLVFYSNPIYPFAHTIFTASHPFRKGGDAFVSADNLAVQFALKGTLPYKLAETAKALFTFSFIPHDWWAFHQDRPVFGSLFTLLLPVLLFMRATTDLWINTAWVHLGLAVWFMTSHEDRYIQSIMPWMAACTAAFLALAWRSGSRAVRVSVAALVLFQVAWGADLYFLRTHAMAGDSILKKTVDYLSAGYDKRYAERFRLGGSLQDVAPALPKGSKVLIHEIVEKVGIGKPTVADVDNWQLGIAYLEYPAPRDTAAVWRRMGITHTVWKGEALGQTLDRLAQQAVFLHALEVYGEPTQYLGGYHLNKLNYEPTPKGAETPTRVAWLGCGGDPPLGVYVPANLDKRQPERAITPLELSNDPTPALAGASVAILRPSCAGLEPAMSVLNASFRRVMGAGDVSLWVRSR
jgi:hypothetical protein